MVRQPGFHLTVMAQVPVKEGQELTITYLPSLFLSLLGRRAVIRKTWFFDCSCLR